MQPMGSGTCRSAKGEWSMIDYSVVSRHLKDAVTAVHTVSGEAPVPHLPVELHLSKTPRAYRERVLKRVKQSRSPRPWDRHQSHQTGAR